MKIESIRNIMNYSFLEKDCREECEFKGCKKEATNINNEFECDDKLCNEHLKFIYKRV